MLALPSMACPDTRGGALFKAKKVNARAPGCAVAGVARNKRYFSGIGCHISEQARAHMCWNRVVPTNSAIGKDWRAGQRADGYRRASG